MNEAHAIVYSSLGEQDFTGIGISCGAGMFDVCVAYKTIPALTFSVARGGDWIDEHVSRVMGIPRVRATAIKESDIDLMAPKTREQEAIVLHYRNLISYVLQNFKQRFMLARDVPQFTDRIEIVIGGGTSLIGGFVDVFAQEIKKVGLPIRSPARGRRAVGGRARLPHRGRPRPAEIERRLAIVPSGPRDNRAGGEDSAGHSPTAPRAPCGSGGTRSPTSCACRPSASVP